MDQRINEENLQITVGIPTKNNVDTIGETLNSLLNQTRLPDRIIIVDDSNDGTKDLVKSINDETTVSVDYYKQNNDGVGVGGARQQIYNLFNEDILACLDSNKIVDKDWIKKRIEFHLKNPRYSILSGAPKPDINRQANGVKDPYFLRQSNCSITSEALDKVNGWDKFMSRGEDWDLRIRLWSAGCRSYVNGDLSCEFIQPDGKKTLITKIFDRPSSVNFIRKYGFWYITFHPLHIIGDLSSFIGLIGLIFAFILGIFINSVYYGLIIFPIFLSIFYIYFKVFHQRTWRSFRIRNLLLIPRFFVLGITAIKQLIFDKSYQWNYKGFK